MEVIRRQPFVVAGMHRSGTSLTASMLDLLGIEMGDHLVPANSANLRGYFEDADFVAFHRRLFRSIHPAGAAGYVDWGWVDAMSTSSSAEPNLRQFYSDARRLAALREQSAAGRWWGFKDPRTTVLLDFWDTCLDDARYVFVYRAPWLVADSTQRLKTRAFLENPHYTYRIWNYYNTRLLDFCSRNRERCLLLNIDGLVADTARLPALLHAKFGVEPSHVDHSARIDSSLIHTNDDPILGDLVLACMPHIRRTYEQLESYADIRDPNDAGCSWSGYTQPIDPIAVSIVIPTYDDAIFLLEALASVEHCRSSDAEVIIVNDGTSDSEDQQILQALKDLGFTVIDQPNRGLAAARNVGVACAVGSLILPLDADNRLLGGFIEAARAKLEQDAALGVAYGDIQLFGELTGRVRVSDFDLRKMVRASYIEPCALYRRALWVDVGGYDEDMPLGEDWEFWLHAGSRGWRFLHLDFVSFDYRVRPGSLLGRSSRVHVIRRVWARLLEKHYGLLYRAMPRFFRSAAEERKIDAGSPLGRRARLITGLYWRSRWLPRGLVVLFGARVWWRRVLRRVKRLREQYFSQLLGP